MYRQELQLKEAQARIEKMKQESQQAADSMLSEVLLPIRLTTATHMGSSTNQSVLKEDPGVDLSMTGVSRNVGSQPCSGDKTQLKHRETRLHNLKSAAATLGRLPRKSSQSQYATDLKAYTCSGDTGGLKLLGLGDLSHHQSLNLQSAQKRLLGKSTAAKSQSSKQRPASQTGRFKKTASLTDSMMTVKKKKGPRKSSKGLSKTKTAAFGMASQVF